MFKIIRKICVMTLLVAGCVGCGAREANISSLKAMDSKDSGDVIVNIATTEGNIKVRLFGDTPKHRDNFLKLAREGYYDGVLFHRVINEFMIQTGDPDSKNAPMGKHLGAGGPGYTLDAEFVYPKHFHKRGALAAARQGDAVNPEKRSSGSQFYIVTGKAYSAEELAQMEMQLENMKKQGIFRRLVAQKQDTIRTMQAMQDRAGLDKLQTELIAITESEYAKNPSKLTPEQLEAYSSVGGTPHLDGDYTVFGQVIEGMDVIEKIEKAKTDSHDRPAADIKIINVTVE
ncbi:MAG: peptidylprolyl isomerase [Muribaculaceae bacterium]|nr:peptidylprolyl isomerase [Muribaculaceae bacterium]